MEKLDITNICGGSVPEIFRKLMDEITKNIRDPNTSPEAKRSVTLTFTFKPYNDRSGAEINCVPKVSTAPVAAFKGTMFVSAAEGKLSAYPKDPRQDGLFMESSTPKQ